MHGAGDIFYRLASIYSVLIFLLTRQFTPLGHRRVRRSCAAFSPAPATMPRCCLPFGPQDGPPRVFHFTFLAGFVSLVPVDGATTTRVTVALRLLTRTLSLTITSLRLRASGDGLEALQPGLMTIMILPPLRFR